MNSLLQFGLGAFVLLVLFSSFRSCSSSSRYGDTYNVSVQQVSGGDAASGLDLQAVGALVKQAETGEEFERLLNTPSVGVNNLDLDEDGSVDYIKVTEYGSGNVKGFSLTVDLASDQTQEVATIEIEKTADGRANVQTHGNRNIYGANHYYHNSFGITDMLLLGWLFNSNRPYYSSPWGYNSYPGYYGRYSPSSYDNYRQRTRNVTNSANWSASNNPTVNATATSPNAGKTAANIKAPLKSPTNSQKSFQARNPSKTVRSGGFGRTSTSSTSPSLRKTTTSSYRGGGK
ncbi:hypothetical protein [Pelagicoccus sp. SDUM812002]|uniref:hypothetical protein n=1 Tax=Pelagicoccus sp. SDUM812002 TaxID=3041266 RepID=UPI0028107FDB|nr:hypothetical protein [Pelagicoccus sp. SDUM812002]MDQ8184747.1 hypothetical protein [Pelagicoccus sp. SDUM812002]